MGNECSSVGTSDGIVLDRLFEIFSENRRRRVLRVLAKSSTSLTLEELAETVAADETDRTRTEDVVASLHHSHLPRLADSGIVKYGGPDGRIEYVATERLDEMVSALLAVDARFG